MTSDITVEFKPSKCLNQLSNFVILFHTILSNFEIELLKKTHLQNMSFSKNSQSKPVKYGEFDFVLHAKTYKKADNNIKFLISPKSTHITIVINSGFSVTE